MITITSDTSPRPNFPVSSFAARDDSAVGSWKPLGDSSSATVTPKAPMMSINSAAVTITRRGAAIPAVRPAQRAYFDYWSMRNIDVTPFFTVLDGPRIEAPGGAGFAAGYQAITPYFDEMFLGRRPVAPTLAAAQHAANTAAQR